MTIFMTSAFRSPRQDGSDQIEAAETDEILTEEEVTAANELIKAGAFDSDDDELFSEDSNENKRKLEDDEDTLKKFKVDTFVDRFDKIAEEFVDSKEYLVEEKTLKEENETTPKRTLTQAKVPIVQKSGKTSSQASVKKYFKAKKRLSYSACNTVKSYSLINLHKTLLGKDIYGGYVHFYETASISN